MAFYGPRTEKNKELLRKPNQERRKELLQNGLKHCTRCEQILPVSSFGAYTKYGNKHYFNSACKTCVAREVREYRRAHPAEVSASKKKRRLKDRVNMYGITESRLAEMFASQNKSCAICGTTTPGGRHGGTWSIDHDHKCCASYKSCGRCVRGVLCFKCNHGLGSFKDNVSVLRKAADYLEKYAQPLH